MGEIIQLRDNPSTEEEAVVEEAVEVEEEVVEEEEVPQSEVDAFDMEFFTTPEGARAMAQMLKNLGETIAIMKDIWNTSKYMYSLTEDQMHAVGVYNREHITPPSDEQKEAAKRGDESAPKWDPFNGLDHITEEEVAGIFGEGHNIICEEHSDTVSLIKDCYRELYDWVSSTKQYQDTYRDWIHFREMVESEKMAELKEAADSIEDEEEKKEALAALDHYWYIRNLAFLADDKVITDDIKNRIVAAYSSKEKIGYMMERSLDKLPRLSIPKSWMLELNNFEKRFMDSKYSSKDDLLLLLVLQMLAYCNPDDSSDDRGSFVYSILLGVDVIIRNACSDERKSAMLANIAAYEDVILATMDE